MDLRLIFLFLAGLAVAAHPVLNWGIAILAALVVGGLFAICVLAFISESLCRLDAWARRVLRLKPAQISDSGPGSPASIRAER